MLIKKWLLVVFLFTGWLPALRADLVYVCNSATNTISVINTATNSVVATVSTNPFGNPSGIAFTPNGQLGYIMGTSPPFNLVGVLDVATNTIVHTVGLSGTGGLGFTAVTADGNFVYVTVPSAGLVNVIRTSNNTIAATITVGTQPTGLAIAPNGRVYVCNQLSDNVSVIDSGSNTVIATVSPGAASRPIFCSVTSDGSKVYVTDLGTNAVSVISTGSNTITATVSGVLGPTGITITPSNFAYVVNVNSTVSVIDTTTNTHTATITVGSSGGNSSYDSVTTSGSFVTVSNRAANTVSLINTSSNTVVATLAVGTSPFGSAAIPTNIPTPSSLGPTGFQLANRFLTQTDFVNIISWNAPSNFTPTSYKIFRDAANTTLAGTVSGSTLEFEDHNRVKKVFYTYFIVAVNAAGTTLNIGSIVVEPIM
ncbi:MAG TPA: beta-propeller fold lactonase family protein [Rhabdochlamydiaceae bacterium]|nr:beta-propeller fold lactonase family protein [Rhabdochlamydiaceae bacterium]